MPLSLFEFVNSLKSSFSAYIQYYRDTNIAYTSITAVGIIFGASGWLQGGLLQDSIRATGLLVLVASLLYTYLIGRPFGVQFEWIPTHFVDGQREADTMSASRNIALAQEDSTLIHGTITLSRLTNSFEIEFNTSEEIALELESVPRAEHQYDPEENLLSCDNVTEREFPLRIEIFPNGSSVESGRYHSVEVSAIDSRRELAQFELLDTRQTAT